MVKARERPGGASTGAAASAGNAVFAANVANAAAGAGAPGPSSYMAWAWAGAGAGAADVDAAAAAAVNVADVAAKDPGW